MSENYVSHKLRHNLRHMPPNKNQSPPIEQKAYARRFINVAKKKHFLQKCVSVNLTFDLHGFFCLD